MVAVGIFSGVLLPELHNPDIPIRISPFSWIYTGPLTLLSLFLMSFPSEFQRQTRWSYFLYRLHYRVFPANAFIDRSWTSVGSMLLCFTAVMSPHLRRVLTHRVLLWLGKISFPLYLLHGSFMRSILSWLLFANQSLVEMQEHNGQQAYVVMKYPLPSTPTFWFVIPIFFAILFPAAHLWTVMIEPHFGAITKHAEEIFYGKGESGGRPTPLPVSARQD